MLCGTLFVPGGKARFNATVASLHHAAGGGYLKSVGCRVEWATEEDRNRSESLLYGSDLQLHVMALSERGGTFLERMSQLLEGRSEPPRSWRLWAPISYDTADNTLGVGLISNGDPSGRDRHLLLFFAGAVGRRHGGAHGDPHGGNGHRLPSDTADPY